MITYEEEGSYEEEETTVELVFLVSFLLEKR
jgi:hypothetical protein